MIFETERLYTREMTMDDLGDLGEILQDVETMYAYEHGFSQEETEAWLLRQLERYENDGYGLWAVILKSSGKMIGQCGLTNQAWEDVTVPEIGYLFNRAYWHQGFAFEAAAGCKKHAFETLRLPEVYSIIRDINLSSMNVAIRNGMTIRGRFMKHYWGVDMPHYVFTVKNPAL